MKHIVYPIQGKGRDFPVQVVSAMLPDKELADPVVTIFDNARHTYTLTGWAAIDALRRALALIAEEGGK